jgi:hypothetical protein
VAAGALGVIVALLSALDGLLKSQQLWLEYRTTAETLKHQKFLYLTRTEPYDQGDAFHVLVQNVENIISSQNSRWQQQMSKKRGESKGDAGPPAPRPGQQP